MTRTLMLAVLLAATSFTVAAAPDPTPVEKYDVLTGDGLAGSGFVVQYAGKFWGVASLHQFDGKTPAIFIRLEGDDIRVDQSSRVKQDDVQAMPVREPAPDLQYLRYEPKFELKEGDELIILGPAGDVVAAKLAATGLNGRVYASSAGPAVLEATATKPFPAGGGSGGPVLLKKTGSVIGVLLTADEADEARKIGFETLCLDRATPAPVVPGLKDALAELLVKLPKRSGWELEPVEFDPAHFERAYIPLPHPERKPLVQATRQIVGFAGMGGTGDEEATSFTVFELTDAKIAKNLPHRFAEGYRDMQPLLRAGGIRIDDLKIRGLNNVSNADAATLIRARGVNTDAQRPFSNTIIRATRGRHMMELTLRNLDMMDDELTAFAAAALEMAAKQTKSPTTVPAK